VPKILPKTLFFPALLGPASHKKRINYTCNVKKLSTSLCKQTNTNILRTRNCSARRESQLRHTRSAS